MIRFVRVRRRSVRRFTWALEAARTTPNGLGPGQVQPRLQPAPGPRQGSTHQRIQGLSFLEAGPWPRHAGGIAVDRWQSTLPAELRDWGPSGSPSHNDGPRTVAGRSPRLRPSASDSDCEDHDIAGEGPQDPRPTRGCAPRPRSAGQPGEKALGLLAPRVEQSADECRPAVELAGHVEVEVQQYFPDLDAPVRLA